ncbi:hypothetical protein EMMF5_002295 [Cystobasidiomycetes sp. EMM_F5]
MAEASTDTTTILLPGRHGLSELEVQVKAPSAATLALRARVDTFIKASYEIWRRRPEYETGVIATAAALDEVIHSASAFHCNSTGTVDMVWIKKDMPREALLDADVGYWLAQAGPAAQHEQLELRKARFIPQQVVDDIRKTNNMNLISHYYYAFIDFWCIVCTHLLIWLACIFFWGILCIIRPNLVIAESSKIYRIFMEYTPEVIFKKDIIAADFSLFLNGVFSYQSLRNMIVFTDGRKWNDLKYISKDYVAVIGIPCIVRYGPRPEHSAIYVAKYHPYANYHIPSTLNVRLELDRRARVMATLAEIYVTTHSHLIPNNDDRESALISLISLIMQDAARLGYLEELRLAKLAVVKANISFLGPRSNEDSPDPDVKHLKHQNAGYAASEERKALAVIAVGAPSSKERSAWVVEVINKVRGQREQGMLIKLAACPRGLLHGSVEHAQWLYTKPAKDADIVNSASAAGNYYGISDKEKEERRRAPMEAVSAKNTYTCNLDDLLEHFALCKADRPRRSIFLKECPHCRECWITKAFDANAGHHACKVIRAQFCAILSDAEDQRQAELADAAAATAPANRTDEDIESSRLGVTRCAPATALVWNTGERIDNEHSIFSIKPVKVSKGRVYVTRAAPLYERAMDDRGRLATTCVHATPLLHFSDLVRLKKARSCVVEDDCLEKYERVKLSDWIKENPSLVPKKCTTKMAAEISKPNYARLLYTGKLDWTSASLKEQALHLLNGTEPQQQDAEYGIEDIRQAYTERISINKLKPLFYDFKERKDMLFVENQDKQ